MELYDGYTTCEVESLVGFTEKIKKLLLISKFCNSTIETNNNGTIVYNGDMTDTAIHKMAAQYSDLLKGYSASRTRMVTFNSTVKMAGAVVDFDNIENPFEIKKVFLVKGGWDVVLKKCEKNMDINEIEKIRLQAKTYASKAYRVIAFAYKEMTDDFPNDLPDNVYDDLHFVGLVGIQDPPREKVSEAIKNCKNAHVNVRMITGDAVDTAFAIAKKIGILAENVIDGATDCSVFRSNMAEEEKEKLIMSTFVFARALPEDKIKIVSVLQKNNKVVAMTGDGVNDAPALKKADIGIAMGSGTAVAKAASKMILVNDSFESIVKAIEEGRVIYANINKFVYFMLTTNPAEVFLILITTLIGLQAALSPTQILWLNLASDLFSALALIMEPVEQYVMEQVPRDRNATMLNAYMFKSIVFHTIVQSIVTIGAYLWALYYFSGKRRYNSK
jgi:Ca2+-transporting ATPase